MPWPDLPLRRHCPFALHAPELCLMPPQCCGLSASSLAPACHGLFSAQLASSAHQAAAADWPALMCLQCHAVHKAQAHGLCRSAPMDEPFEGPAPALPPPLAPPPPPPGTPRPGGFAGGFESIWSGSAAEPCQGMTDWVPGSISAVWGTSSAPRRPEDFSAQQPTTPRCSSPARRQVSW